MSVTLVTQKAKPTLRVHETRIVHLESRLRRLENGLDTLTSRLAERDARIGALYASRSWRVTAFPRKLATALRLLKAKFWRSELARHRKVAPSVPVDQRPTLAVIAWDVCHNPLGRAYMIAEALSGLYNVMLLGPAFPRFGGVIWEPLQDAQVAIVPIPGENFPEFLYAAETVASRLKADVVIACKPRLPSLLLGHLLKRKRNTPLFVDIDDYELSFTKSDTPIELEEVAQANEDERRAPDSDTWTRYASNFLGGCDGLFVSNHTLQSVYGGIVVPHARDEEVFDPKLYDRTQLRRGMGLTVNDRVVLFAGTPRAHKGLSELCEAIASIPDDRIKLLVVGQPEKSMAQRMRELLGDRLLLLGNRPFGELATFVSCADLVCLLQDPKSRIAKFQLPAKVADALAFGIPVLASSVPPLQPLFEAGVVSETTRAALSADIESSLNRSEPLEEKQRRRQYFLDHFSYSAIRETVRSAILEASANPVEPSSSTIRVRREALRIKPKAQASSEPEDGGSDVVLVWKQRDMFVYGRRVEMLAKYLAARSDIRSVSVLELPLSTRELYTWAKENYDQNRLLYVQWLRKSWGVLDSVKLKVHNFTYVTGNRTACYPNRQEYMTSLDNFFSKSHVDPTDATFIVFPKNKFIPQILRRYSPRLVIGDIVDDHRFWPDVTEEKKLELTDHYREVLGMCTFAITNCEPIKESMSIFNEDVRLLPNGIDPKVDAKTGYSKRLMQLKRLRSQGVKVIGYAGNLESKIDIRLIQFLARSRPNWRFVLIGSTHANPEVRTLKSVPNVDLVGVVQYEEAKLWIREFDVAIIPHLKTELTRNMNPLKFYLYVGMGVPVVSTPVDNLIGEELLQYVTVAERPEQFLAAIENWLSLSAGLESLEGYELSIERHSWAARVDTLCEWIRQTRECQV
jgi:glycosyltransferase involved in cell wall biosynthesis